MWAFGELEVIEHRQDVVGGARLASSAHGSSGTSDGG